MSLTDEENTSFYTGWDIEKLITNSSTSISIAAYNGTSTVVSLAQYAFTKVPKVMCLINYGDGNWYLSGGRLGSSAGRVVIQTTTSSVVARSITGAVNATVKYWIFSSELNP